MSNITTQVTTQRTLLDTASPRLVKTANVSEGLASSSKVGSAVRGRTIPPLVSALKEASSPRNVANVRSSIYKMDHCEYFRSSQSKLITLSRQKTHACVLTVHSTPIWTAANKN
jgi:hypothetical protein